ncbi:PAS domain-containing protein [Massilia sp. Se16.2.3]|uniref:PAS domain-containing protein n=1 Tax=Massilia sp. Se16.2.3 TaxID=2709303 RepID=UPI001E422D8B|nr:PAS domain-containing protein [Massilia sp. Se16.2.3]
MTLQRNRSRRGRGAAVFALGLLGGHLIARLNADHHGDSPARHSRRIVDNAGEAIISADETSRIVLANPAAASMFGLTAAQMLGQPRRASSARRPMAAIAPSTISWADAPAAAPPTTPGSACARAAIPSPSKARSPTPSRTASPSTPSSCATSRSGTASSTSLRARTTSCASCRLRCRPSARRNAPTSRASCTTTSGNCWPRCAWTSPCCARPAAPRLTPSA